MKTYFSIPKYNAIGTVIELVKLLMYLIYSLYTYACIYKYNIFEIRIFKHGSTQPI